MSAPGAGHSPAGTFGKEKREFSGVFAWTFPGDFPSSEHTAHSEVQGQCKEEKLALNTSEGTERMEVDSPGC